MEDEREASDPTLRSGDIQAVERAAHILALFNSTDPELTVPMVAGRLGLNRTTVHRYFTSLIAAGLLGRGEEPGSYVPGPLAVQLGTFTLGRRLVVDLADRHLRDLSQILRMSAVLSLWGPRGPVVTTVREDRTGAVLITVPVGTQLSLDTAQSVLYLAFMPDQLLSQRLRVVLPTSSQRELATRVETARREGLASQVFQDGITSIAAPVFSPDGICATIALIHTSAMLSSDVGSIQAGRLRATAAELTNEMGASPALSELSGVEGTNAH